MDAATFRIWAKPMHRRSDAPMEDAMIAATALLHQPQVVTRNVGDFKGFGVRAWNPWTYR
jgi:toxin FitB